MEEVCLLYIIKNWKIVWEVYQSLGLGRIKFSEGNTDTSVCVAITDVQCLHADFCADYLSWFRETYANLWKKKVANWLVNTLDHFQNSYLLIVL